jgi:hypothetical protein
MTLSKKTIEITKGEMALVTDRQVRCFGLDSMMLPIGP